MPKVRFRSSFALMLLVASLSAGAAALHAQSRNPQLAELTPSTRSANDGFGLSIAVSGNTVVVGEFNANIEQFGSAKVYVKPSTGWMNMTQVATLTSSDSGQGFGVSVAISGNTIVVGAANTSNFRPQSAGPGAAYVFVQPASGWADMTETAKLTASDGLPGDAFGDSVSISGGTIAAGAFFASDASGNGFAGKAYVFVRPSAGWSGNLSQTAELTASDSVLLNYLGVSIATNGTTVVAGADGHNNFQGAGYVFVEPSGGWANMTQTAELTAADGGPSQDFGFSAAISQQTAVMGSPNGYHGKGAAYVFVKPAAGWINMTQTAELVVPHGAAGEAFGQSAAISGRAVVVGAPSATVGANQGQGAAYVFIQPPSGWQNTPPSLELIATDGAANDSFGLSASLSGNTALLGAPASGAPGAAYIFGR